MITRDEAAQIAAEVAGPADAGDGNGWVLEEFSDGWLIRPGWLDQPGTRGGTLLVVERDSGRVMRFTSATPPGRILDDYALAVEDAFPVSRG
ncbi:MAG: hypothetical protein ABSA02_24935 [Trebonia sp.]|jgi:hypothetical protein